MLSVSQLKAWLQKELTNTEKGAVILASLGGGPSPVKDIRARALEAGLRKAKDWNFSALFERSRGLVIPTPAGWELSDKGNHHLQSLGIGATSPAVVHVATSLRKELAQLKDDNTKRFLDEAIKCFEWKQYKAAIIMSWVGAVYVLRKEIHSKHLADFNAEVARINPKWKNAKSLDDFGRIDEFEFLERITAISVIGKNVKEDLQACLKRRNGCGHPSSLKVAENTAAHHIETLLLNVFQVFPL